MPYAWAGPWTIEGLITEVKEAQQDQCWNFAREAHRRGLTDLRDSEIQRAQDYRTEMFSLLQWLRDRFKV